MSRKIGFFVDISDLYGQVQRLHKTRRLDYQKYYDYVKDLGLIQCAIAYGCQKHNEADGFIHALEKIGFETKYQRVRPDPRHKGPIRADWDVTITLDVVARIEQFDTLILGSSCKTLLPLIEWCKERGIMVILLAACVGKKMERGANKTIEIPESLLECSP